MGYNRKCEWFSMEYVGNPGAVPACNHDKILEAFDCSDCKENPANKKMTNADRIRAMTDEGLAMLLNPTCPNRKCPDDEPHDCYQCWLNWLKQEVKE